MIIISEDRLFFGGEDGETITVTLKSLNTRHAVNAILDGAPKQMTSTGTQSSTLSFKLDMSKHDPSILLLFFQFFSAAGGGLYKVVVKGDKGPKTFTMVVDQLNSVATSKIFSFDVI